MVLGQGSPGSHNKNNDITNTKKNISESNITFSTSKLDSNGKKKVENIRTYPKP